MFPEGTINIILTAVHNIISKWKTCTRKTASPCWLHVAFFANCSNVKTSSVRLNQQYFIWSSFSQTTTIPLRPLQLHWQHLSFQLLQMWALAMMLAGCFVDCKENESLFFRFLIFYFEVGLSRSGGEICCHCCCYFVCWFRGALRKIKQKHASGQRHLFLI